MDTMANESGRSPGASAFISSATSVVAVAASRSGLGERGFPFTASMYVRRDTGAEMTDVVELTNNGVGTAQIDAYSLLVEAGGARLFEVVLSETFAEAHNLSTGSRLHGIINGKRRHAILLELFTDRGIGTEVTE